MLSKINVGTLVCGIDTEVPEVPVPVPMVIVEPGGDVALQFVYLQGFMGMDESTL
jgi:hypothetical protein